MEAKESTILVENTYVFSKQRELGCWCGSEASPTHRTIWSPKSPESAVRTSNIPDISLGRPHASAIARYEAPTS